MPATPPEELISTYAVVFDGVQYVVRLNLIKHAVGGKLKPSDATVERFCEQAHISRTTLWRLLAGVPVSAGSVKRVIEAAGLTREDVEADAQAEAEKPAFVLLAAPLREEAPPLLRPHLWRDLLLAGGALLAMVVSGFLDGRIFQGRITTDGLSFPLFVLAAFFLTGRLLYATLAASLIIFLASGLIGVPWITVGFHAAELLVVGWLTPALKHAEARWRAKELASALNGQE